MERDRWRRGEEQGQGGGKRKDGEREGEVGEHS